MGRLEGQAGIRNRGHHRFERAPFHRRAFCLAWVILASKIVGESGTSPETTRRARAAPDMLCTFTSCSAILSRYSRPKDSIVLPIQRVPVEVLTIDILPFHLGFNRSSMVLGASAGGITEVLKPKLA
jgi:hypothetical protein